MLDALDRRLLAPGARPALAGPARFALEFATVTANLKHIKERIHIPV